MHTTIRAVALSTLVPFGMACDSDEEDHGTAPSIESLTLSGDGAVVGGTSTIHGMVSFSDPDGDLESAEIDVVAPDQTKVSIVTPIAGASGVTGASVAIQLVVVGTQAGRYETTVVLVDAEGNESEPEIVTFDVP